MISYMISLLPDAYCTNPPGSHYASLNEEDDPLTRGERPLSARGERSIVPPRVSTPAIPGGCLILF